MRRACGLQTAARNALYASPSFSNGAVQSNSLITARISVGKENVGPRLSPHSLGHQAMPARNFFCLKLVRWTGWLLLPVVLAFFATGHAISGRGRLDPLPLGMGERRPLGLTGPRLLRRAASFA